MRCFNELKKIVAKRIYWPRWPFNEIELKREILKQTEFFMRFEKLQSLGDDKMYCSATVTNNKEENDDEMRKTLTDQENKSPKNGGKSEEIKALGLENTTDFADNSAKENGDRISIETSSEITTARNGMQNVGKKQKDEILEGVKCPTMQIDSIVSSGNGENEMIGAFLPTKIVLNVCKYFFYYCKKF